MSDDGQNITVKKGDRSLSQEPNPELKQVAGNDSDAELPSTGKETIVESDWVSFWSPSLLEVEGSIWDEG